MKNYALVTGSADRIGKAVALHLAEQGYSLLLHYNSSAEKAQKVKDEIDSLGNGVNAKLLQFNFLEENDFDQMFADLKRENVTLDILVNCASDFVPSNFEMKGSKLLDKELDINFKNAYKHQCVDNEWLVVDGANRVVL